MTKLAHYEKISIQLSPVQKIGESETRCVSPGPIMLSVHLFNCFFLLFIYSVMHLFPTWWHKVLAIRKAHIDSRHAILLRSLVIYVLTFGE